MGKYSDNLRQRAAFPREMLKRGECDRVGTEEDETQRRHGSENEDLPPVCERAADAHPEVQGPHYGAFEAASLTTPMAE